MSGAITHPRLTSAERLQFEACESTISKGLQTFVEVGSALVVIRDQKLYRVGFASFEDYLRDRWDMSRPRAYQLIDAAREVENLSTRVDKPTSEKHVRALRPLPPEERGDAWEEAVETAPDGKVTSAHVRAVVERRSAPPEPEPEPESPPRPKPRPKPEPAPAGKSRINGEVVDDPPAVARQRAKGLIPAAVVPEVIEPAPALPEPEDAAPEPEADDDEAWLESLPIRAKLAAGARALFDRDALGYRKLDDHRKGFGRAVRATLKAADRKGGSLPPYLYAMSRFLTLDDPSRWSLCPPADKGGCGGAGTVGILGKCPACKGYGYRL